MLELILKLYTMAIAGDVRSPLPHLVGPPGCGKSTVVEKAAEIIGCKLHIINLSRLSPLELEGVQMPHTTVGDDGIDIMKLKLLHATFWVDIEEGDIVLFDELLRAFPEVFNGLLDILTSRQVAGLKIPKALFLGASNSVVAYDKALEDRLLHIPVPDIRSDKKAKADTARILVDALGLMPEMVKVGEMNTLIDSEIAPMYDILDVFNGKSSTSMGKGTSVRKLIGMAKLRDVRSDRLRDLIDVNNYRALHEGKPQFVLLYDGNTKLTNYEQSVAGMKMDNLTATQRLNLTLNLQLLKLEKQRHKKGPVSDDEPSIFE